jgi:hypothetical protein
MSVVTSTQCHQCSKTFRIEARDFEFYQRLQVPAPTHCPDCRTQRRMAWRNERSIYSATCATCHKPMLSRYHLEAGYTVYCQTCYRSENWDAAKYGRDIDWSKPFFEQWSTLEHAVPQINMYSVRSENSDYCNYSGDAKNCYLCFGSIVVEDCLFGSPYHSKQCVDSLLIRDCELCYECITCERLYHCFWCRDCFDSRDLLMCFDVKASHDCIGSVGLRNAAFQVFNQQLTEAEYRRCRSQLDLKSPVVLAELRQKFETVFCKTPHRYMTGLANENVSGNHLNSSHNAWQCFDATRVESTSYSAQVIDLKDCYDNNYTEENELCYEYWGNYRNCHCLFSSTSYGCREMFYSALCESSKSLFGCVGLRKAEYCILNKAYTTAEYEQLTQRLIAHMKDTDEWGEFFPARLSPFAYNETVAQEYFPLTQEQVQQRDWGWRDVPIIAGATAGQDILQCTDCHKSYKCIPQELKFYAAEGLAVPVRCPNCRHLARMAQRTPRSLWSRQCMCTQVDHGHRGRCVKEFSTTYAPERKELVYCDACYIKEIV